MKNFVSVNDVDDLPLLIAQAKALKQDPFAFSHLGKHRTIGLVFMNPSLRTRLSTQKAAASLGMDVIVLNIDKEGWQLEMNEGAVMNGTTVEHIRDAARVISSYCEMVAIRCFAGLKNRDEDYSETVLNGFLKYCTCPVISLESATLHPLQSLADCITISEHTKKKKPKVVLTWAPHVKPLPQAVANSFAQWMSSFECELVITRPRGYDLPQQFTQNASLVYDQQEALENADFVYIKSWSSYEHYGTMPAVQDDWRLTSEKLEKTNSAYIMHCLPVRRNVEVYDEILDAPYSLIYEQALNRVYAAQAVLKQILQSN